MSFGNNANVSVRRGSFGTRNKPQGDGASDDVLAILEAASDLDDRETVAACRRIIEANRTGAQVSQADMQRMLTYFR